MACKPVSAPAAVCQAALANCTSHHKHTQPEALSSPAISPLWWKYRAELRAVATNTGRPPLLVILILKLILEYLQHCVSPCVLVPTVPSPSLWEPAVAHQALMDAVLSAEPTVRALSAAHPASSPFSRHAAQNSRVSFLIAYSFLSAQRESISLFL